jgi:mitochondrial chaperone BCS1
MNNKDRAYAWFLAWMAHNSNAGVKSRTSTWFKSHQLSVSTIFEQGQSRSSFSGFDITAGPGMHWFKYRGAWMQVR